MDLWDQSSAYGHRTRESETEKEGKQVVHLLLHIATWTHAARSSQEKQFAYSPIVFAKKAYGKSIPPVLLWFRLKAFEAHTGPYWTNLDLKGLLARTKTQSITCVFLI